MGIKRRAMFNPKFKHSRPDRWQKGQNMLNTKSNSEAIEIIKQNASEDNTIDTSEIVEEMIKEVEELVKQADTPTYKTFELKKKKKAELLQIANDLNCSVTIKNTKTQIIKAIEKQSA
mgnify:CR=1 FL=1